MGCLVEVRLGSDDALAWLVRALITGVVKAREPSLILEAISGRLRHEEEWLAELDAFEGLRILKLAWSLGVLARRGLCGLDSARAVGSLLLATHRYFCLKLGHAPTQVVGRARVDQHPHADAGD
jgi:hypothetical protein